jgi:hypothetical protein
MASAGGADVLAAASASLASASLALRLPPLRDDPAADLATLGAWAAHSAYPDEDRTDDALAADALRHARQLYTFALALQAQTQGRPYCTAIPCHEGRREADGGGYRWLAFPSSSASEKLAFAAGWLWKATSVDGYLEDARAHLARHASSGEARPLDPSYYAPNYANLFFPAAIFLGSHDLAAPPPVARLYRDALSSFSRAWLSGRTADGLFELMQQTPRGLAYLPAPDGAPLPNALAAAHLAMQAAAAIRRQQQQERGPLSSLPAPAAANLECFARRQVHYALGGRLGQGRSFVVGVGSKSPERPMHRQASCAFFDGRACGVGPGLLSSKPNGVTLTGAVIAGPDAEDGYADDRTEAASVVGFHLQAPAVAAFAALSAPGPVREARCTSDATGAGFATMAAVGADSQVLAPDPLAESII